MAILGGVLVTLGGVQGMALETAGKMSPQTITVKEFAANERPEEGDLWYAKSIVTSRSVTLRGERRWLEWHSRRDRGEAARQL
jgi:hypothetical protein